MQTLQNLALVLYLRKRTSPVAGPQWPWGAGGPGSGLQRELITGPLGAVSPAPSLPPPWSFRLALRIWGQDLYQGLTTGLPPLAAAGFTFKSQRKFPKMQNWSFVTLVTDPSGLQLWPPMPLVMCPNPVRVASFFTVTPHVSAQSSPGPFCTRPSLSLWEVPAHAQHWASSGLFRGTLTPVGPSRCPSLCQTCTRVWLHRCHMLYTSVFTSLS